MSSNEQFSILKDTERLRPLIVHSEQSLGDSLIITGHANIRVINQDTHSRNATPPTGSIVIVALDRSYEVSPENRQIVRIVPIVYSTTQITDSTVRKVKSIFT